MRRNPVGELEFEFVRVIGGGFQVIPCGTELATAFQMARVTVRRHAVEPGVVPVGIQVAGFAAWVWRTDGVEEAAGWEASLAEAEADLCGPHPAPAGRGLAVDGGGWRVRHRVELLMWVARRLLAARGFLPWPGKGVGR